MLSKWDRRHLHMAHEAAAWSKDPSTKVGARIASPRAVCISEGFNGPPRGVEDDPTIDRATKLRRTLHAESNAIDFAVASVAGATIYVTHHPCAQCAARIAQNRLARVVAVRPSPEFAERWREDIAEAQSILQKAGVALDLVDWPEPETF